MSRNYENENKWQKLKYETMFCKIDKALGIEFKNKLKSNNISFAAWLTVEAKKYLKIK